MTCDDDTKDALRNDLMDKISLVFRAYDIPDDVEGWLHQTFYRIGKMGCYVSQCPSAQRLIKEYDDLESDKMIEAKTAGKGGAQ